MGETASQIEGHISQERGELSRNISALEASARLNLDWRTQFRARPGVMLSVAFGVGVLLPRLLGENCR
jgi:hypothetical protein